MNYDLLRQIKDIGPTVFNGKTFLKHEVHKGHNGKKALRTFLCVLCAICVWTLSRSSQSIDWALENNKKPLSFWVAQQ
jgi:hypothetical protein